MTCRAQSFLSFLAAENPWRQEQAAAGVGVQYCPVRSDLAARIELGEASGLTYKRLVFRTEVQPAQQTGGPHVLVHAVIWASRLRMHKEHIVRPMAY